MTSDKTVNVEIDTTEFVNVDDQAYDIYINNSVARHFEAGEMQIVPLWVAQVGAKHLVDKILQQKHGIRNTMEDTPLRKSIFAKILPKMAEERSIKPLSPDEFQTELKTQLAKQQEVIDRLLKKDETKISAEQTELAALRAELEALKAAGVGVTPPVSGVVKKAGRPPKAKPVNESSSAANN